MKHIPRPILLFYTACVLVLAIFLFLRFGTRYYVDYLWFASQEQGALWWQLLGAQVYFYMAGVFLALAAYALNYGIAFWRLRRLQLQLPAGGHLFLALAILFVLFTLNGPLLHRLWDTQILANYAPDYGLKDPIYELDASFYMFRLVWYQKILTWLKLLCILCIAMSIALYCLPLYNVNFSSRLQSDSQFMQRLTNVGLKHVAVLFALLILIFSASAYLQRYSLVYSGTSTKVAGASYVDVHARAAAYMIFAYIGVVFAGLIAISGFLRHWRLPLWGLGAWVLVYLLLVQVYPGLVRTLRVNPNEFEAEESYIDHSIAYTLEGYGMGAAKRQKFSVSQKTLDARTIANHREIIDNIRLWDYRPVRATLGQLQEIRQYYDFLDVDVDRYYLHGKMRQVMIAARELNKNSLPHRSRTWESRHLQYTHGYGLAMAPSNTVTPEGLPQLWIRDFPPVTTQSGLPTIKRPEIYYGELNNDYVLVNTGLKEIDYPLEQNFAETVYSGSGGLELGRGLRYFLLAWNFDTWKFLVSHYIRSDSRILWRRNIHQAVRLLAPFLTFDTDPYLVLGEDGRLYWMMDAYTTSTRFPYSEPFSGHYLQTAMNNGRSHLKTLRGINYIRNSIKITIDAYDGTTKFYLSDETDPIAQAWARFLPQLIRPLAEMPDMLLQHIRYPEELFFIQAAIYTDYHMSDARAFYNLEDRWQIATELYSGKPQAVEPYYTVIKLPGQKKEEYILMLPFIPNNKDNMIAWMAARCDYRRAPANIKQNAAGPGAASGKQSAVNPYGEVLVFDFPRTRQIYGPMQIEARIDQDPEISKDLTLWNQQGSRVIRGNLLIIPIGETLLYIEPIYLQSTNSPFPELRRVIAADSRSLVMGENLSDVLSQLADKSSLHSNDDVSDSTQTTTRQLSAKETARQMRSSLQKAQNAAAQGKWAEFGQQMARLKLLIDQQAR